MVRVVSANSREVVSFKAGCRKFYRDEPWALLGLGPQSILDIGKALALIFADAENGVVIAMTIESTEPSGKVGLATDDAAARDREIRHDSHRAAYIVGRAAAIPHVRRTLDRLLSIEY